MSSYCSDFGIKRLLVPSNLIIKGRWRMEVSENGKL